MSAVGDARKRLAESADLDDFEYTLTRRALQQIKVEARAEGAAEIVARVEALADEWEAAGCISVYESAEELAQMLRAALRGDA